MQYGKQSIYNKGHTPKEGENWDIYSHRVITNQRQGANARGWCRVSGESRATLGLTSQ